MLSSVRELCDRRFYGAVAVILVLAGAVSVHGVPTMEVTGRCYTETTRCHGVPVADCLGTESSAVTFADRSSCTVLTNITERCRTGRTVSCQRDGIEGDEWLAETRVFGRPCADWDRAYDLGFEGCPG